MWYNVLATHSLLQRQVMATVQLGAGIIGKSKKYQVGKSSWKKIIDRILLMLTLRKTSLRNFLNLMTGQPCLNVV